jgi:phenylpropionate dioxygenase-like ring-hydroxylating dioxygenase large terminal subunit
MYARNHWYAAGVSSELDAGMLARTILDEPIVMYRTTDGQVVALEDRCSHRNVPLSLGKHVGDAVQCPYHGLEFGVGGACTKMPRVEGAPSSTYAIRAYPAVERDQYIWLWTGDPALADPALIPDYSWHSQEGWTGTVWMKTIKASYVFNNDNLLDLSHVEFVHPTTLSIDSWNEVAMVTEVHENHIDMVRTTLGLNPDDPEVTRYIPDREIPGGYKVDSFTHVRFLAPSNFWLHHKLYKSGCPDDPDAVMERFGGPNTPETASSYHHFMSTYRNYALDDQALTEQLVNRVSTAYAEDEVMMVKQQERVDAGAYPPIKPFYVDKTALVGAKMLERLIERERGALGRSSAIAAE